MRKEKFDNPHPDTTDAFNAEITQIGLDAVLNITVLVDNKLKPDIFKLAKCSPSESFKTGDDINLFLNEDIFIRLTDDLQKLVVVEALAGLSYDYDKDTAVITKPDFYCHSGVISKHGFDQMVILKESIKTLLYAAKEAEDEAKAATKKGGTF